MALKALTFVYQGVNTKDTGLPLWRLALMTAVLEEREEDHACWREVPHLFDLPRNLDHASVTMDVGNAFAAKLGLHFYVDIYEGQSLDLSPTEILALSQSGASE